MSARAQLIDVELWLPASAKNTRNTGSCAASKLAEQLAASAREKLRSQMPAASITISGSR